MRRFLAFAVLLAVSAEVSFAQGLGRSLLNRRTGGARPAAGAPAAKTESQPQMTREDLKNVQRGTNGVPALAFNQAPLDLVLEAYAAEVGKTVIPAPDLPKATITLRSLEGQTLSKAEYLEAIEVTLTMNGVVLEPRGEKFLRALPRKTVRTHGIALRMDDKGNLPEQGRVVSQMIVFKNITVEEAQKALEGFKAPEGLFQVFERTNAILVTDTQENINRMLEVVRAIDIATPVTEDVFVRQIEYALATDIKEHLETIVTESQKDENPKKSGPKQSGAPGFGSSQPAQRPSLLNLRRPGQPAAAPEPTANANLIAAVSDADRGMIRGKVLIVADERSNKLIVITNKSNMDFFDKVIKTLDVETTPEVQIDVIRLKYADAEDVEQMLNDLIGASSSSSSSKNNQNANAKKGGTANSNLTRGTTQNTARKTSSNPTFQNANASRLGELNKDNVKVLADKRINGIVVMARKADMRAIREVIDNMDVKLSQVLIETVIVQVELGDDLSTGIDWIKGTPSRGFNFKGSDMIGGGGGANSANLKKFTGQGSSLADKIKALKEAGIQTEGLKASEIEAYASMMGDVSPIGNGLNYLFTSDKWDLSAVISMAKSDSRTKVLASPILMTVDNKEATIEATDMIYLFSGYQYSGSTYNGSQVRNYEKRDIGLTVKVTPKINPNGTVMLTVEQSFETQGADQNVPNESGGTDPYATITTRKISSDISVENRQTVVMGGMTRKTNTESESGIPILKDIPWVGKWLFGSVNMTEKRSELLVFMTPYVLDDAESAQAEALRRKKTLSDSRPWEDEGWSASPLADPVSRKEQLRRFKDEWKKQDEERKTKLAIEKAKVERASKLEKMSDEERKAWLEIHKDELEKEQREAFEKSVKEQKDLREFVEQLKKQDLEKSEKAIKAADDAEKRSNEYHKYLEDLKKDGKPLPAGETLKKDAEAIAAPKTGN